MEKEQYLRGLLRGLTSDVVGGPVDMAESVVNLGLAGGGYLGHKLGLLNADQLPKLLEASPGSSEWFARKAGNPDSGSAEYGLGRLGPAAASGVKGLATFIGPAAKFANLEKLDLAKALEGSGFDPQLIWSKTGWFKAPDGKWRSEIADSKATLNKGGLRMGPEARMTWGEHPEITANYPALEDPNMISRVTVDPNLKRASGSFIDARNPRIEDQTYSRKIWAEGPNEETGLSAYLHELQHAVQSEEGFARGGSPQQFLRSETPTQQEKQDAFMKYQRLLGETEARATQRRYGLTQEQRFLPENYPLAPGPNNYDTPLDQLIIKGLVKPPKK